MIDLAKLVVSLEAEVGRYQRDLEKANRSTKKFQKKTTESLSFTSNAFKAFAAFFTVRAATNYYQSHAEGIDRIAKQSDKLGLATDALQGLRHAGELSGVSINTLDMGIQRMTRRIAEASVGTGEAKNALIELGLNAQQLATLTTDEQFFAIANAMAKVESQSDKVRLSMKLFDSEGVALVNTLALGEEGLRAARTQVDSFGASISRVDAAKIEAANDQFKRVNQVLGAVGKRVAVETAPVLGALAGKFLESAQESGGLGNITQQVMRSIFKNVGLAADAVRGLKIAWLGVRNVIASVTSTVLDFTGVIANSGANIANKLGFDAERLRELSNFSDSFKQTLQGFKEEFDALVLAPLPSEAVTAWIEDVNFKAETAAREVAANSEGNLGLTLLGDNAVDVDLSPEIKREQEKQTILERMLKNHNSRQLREELRFQLLSKRFAQSSSLGKIGIATNETSQILNIATGGSKKLFKLQKAVGIANALISTYQGIAAGVRLGWPLAIPAVAYATANGFAQVRALRAQTLGGGGGSFGGSSAAAGSVPAVDAFTQLPQGNITPPEELDEEGPGRAVNVFFQGDTYGFEDFEDRIIDTIGRNSDARRIVIRSDDGTPRVEVNR